MVLLLVAVALIAAMNGVGAIVAVLLAATRRWRAGPSA